MEQLPQILMRRPFQSKRKKKRRHFDKESGIGRGIDFHLVPNVVNFDFPLSADMYVHRVGRFVHVFFHALFFPFKDCSRL
jgi:hypothetical protein